MKRRIVVFVCICLHLCWQVASGQSLDKVNLTNILPPTPDVASLGKHLGMDMGYSTGTPNINIPIYTVTSGDLSLPISLSYNASGIKVAEVPTWVGLGWNLQAGGSISRVVRGLPDDVLGNGYMYTTKRVSYIDSLSISSQEHNDIYNNYLAQNVLDVEPDIFLFSALGYSGRFYYNQLAKKFILTPYQNIKIEYTPDANGQIVKWIVTLPNGVKLYFGNLPDDSRPAAEKSGVFSNYTITNGVSSGGPSSTPDHNTAWPVSQILAPSGRKIDFYYQNLLCTDFGRSGETMTYDRSGSTCLNSYFGSNKRQTLSFYNHSYTKPQLYQISTDLCDIKFIVSSQNRQDVVGSERTLDTIVVKDRQNQTIKRFDFSYNYSRATDALPVNPIPVADSIYQKRLVLNRFCEVNDDHSLILPYDFTYSSVPLPSRLSSSQDYWGYYNGKNNGEYLSPRVTIETARGVGSGYEPGADRTVDVIKNQAGTLVKIRYPTGGTTSFNFEPNRAIPGFAGPDLAKIQGSGLTPRSISHGNGIYGPQPVDGGSGSSSYHYVDTFTIHNISGQAEFNSSCDGCSTGLSTNCPLLGTLKGLTNSFNLTIGESFDTYYSLADGTYVLSLDVVPNSNYPTPNFHVVLNWNENAEPNNIVAGGLRVKNIISNDSMGNSISRSYDYTVFGHPDQSSGNIYNLPTIALRCPCGDPYNYGDVTKIQSNSAIPIFSMDGNVIRYKNITEYCDSGRASYKTEYTYSLDALFDQTPYGTSYPPGTPVQSDWRSGLLLERKDYENIGSGIYRVLRDQQYSYRRFQDSASSDFGIKIGFYDGHNSLGGPTFGVTNYSFKTEWYLPDSSYTAEYSYPTGNLNPIINSSSIKNYYNNRYLMAMTRRTNSKGEVIDEHNWYPFEFGNISGFNFNQMTSNGIIGNPVKQEISNNGKITSGQIIKHNAQGKPLTVYEYENNQPADTLAFIGNTILTANYNQKATLAYDNLYNVAQVTPQDKSPTSYIWDYNNNYPIAQVQNATVAGIAYTSFESDGSGNWSIPDATKNLSNAITGSNSYSLSTGKTISASGLSSSTTYIVSYWSTGGSLSVNGTTGTAGTSVGTCTYYEHQVTGAAIISVTGNATIDELRLFPKGSLMTSFTYSPLVGITSQCSPTNYITYYNYDNLKRLAVVRDMRGNIIKTINYNYHK